jgi:hypothetical protein
MGYMHDPRPVWEIPEVCIWSYNTWRMIPYFPCLLTGDGFVGFSLAVCCGMPDEYVADAIAKSPAPAVNSSDPKIHFAVQRFWTYHDQSADMWISTLPAIYHEAIIEPHKHWRVTEAEQRIGSIRGPVLGSLVAEAERRTIR